MHILIPCKSLDTGKSRLSPCLDHDRRRALCEWLLEQTLERALRLEGPEHIRVVSADPRATDIAGRYGVGGLPDFGGGLNAALEDGRAALRFEVGGDGSLLILPIDLPYASVEALVQAVSHSADIVIAPDESGMGTNLLLLRRAAFRRLAFAYGPGSYVAHHAAARALAFTIETVKDWRIAFDLDEPEQYIAWEAREKTS
jgi:2-phospho-L-lactate guanylyltransferase